MRTSVRLLSESAWRPCGATASRIALHLRCVHTQAAGRRFAACWTHAGYRPRSMHVDDAIRSRRTLKEFEDREVPPEVVRELLELAVLAPNHHLTLPWRFWVLGPDTLEQLIRATGDVKLRRS